MSKHDEKVQAIMRQLYALLSDESVPQAATRFSLQLIRSEVDDLLMSLSGAP